MRNTVADIEKSKRLLLEAIPEKAFQKQVNELFERYRYEWYHANDSRRDRAGFLDSFAVGPRGAKAPIIVIVELKTQKGRVRPQQQVWLNVLTHIAGIINPAVGREILVIRLWRPSDLEEIERLLGSVK